ncbi:hypothetical protein HPB49_013812 [Dermacentor silvarum]|uniref:Uncharacterized protein n=1 Tax=Dermacentor silvarum TaxID=543639 RepID=A0ACB8CXM7_DERSI|nr:uncharacterized protein LOC119450682 isoform X3 [Dermacentor silvarum]KAH7953897.1 hypothetical protein HPB49_013812 [Dermacentor silvarum]
MMSGTNEVIMVQDSAASTPNQTVLRANIGTARAAEDWVKKYSAESCTSWIVENVRTRCTRMVFHKVWLCHLNHRNKTRPASLEKPSCPAKLSIKIKKISRGTIAKDKFLRSNRPLPAVIRLISGHNHTVASADAPVSLRSTSETKAQFERYFEMGMIPCEAKLYHERLLAAQGNDTFPHSKAAPDPTSIYNWHKQWRKAKYGSPENPLPKLMEKASAYSASGADVKLSGTEDSWAVMIVTPIMHRAQKLTSAGDLIFVDTVPSCDTAGSTVTSLLTATRAGAVPIAVFIHREQTTKGYQMAFALLRTEYPLCFGNRQVLYARSEEELERAKEEIRQCKHKAYLERAEAFFVREREWSLLCRVDLTAQKQDINAYSEVSIRILRDILLGKMLPYNAVALLEIVITEWEAYLKARILQHSHPASHFDHRCGGSCVKSLAKLLRWTPSASQGIPVVQRESENVFSIRSAPGRIECKVQYDLGLCSCWPGKQGAFCKHQVAVVQEFKRPFPCMPETTAEECRQLVMLALGKRSQSPSSSASPTTQTCNLDSTLDVGEGDVGKTPDHNGLEAATGDTGDPRMQESELEMEKSTCLEHLQDNARVPEEQSYEALVSSLNQVHELAKHVPGYLTLVDRVVSEVKKLETSHAAYGFLLRLDASAAAERHRLLAPTSKRPRKRLRTSVQDKNSMPGAGLH